MSSMMTNTAAMTALQTLRNINSSMETTQSRISTGYRVAEASDNAAYWSIATTMRSDNAALSAVSDALGLGAATVDVAYTGMKSAIDVMDEIKAKLVAATTPGIDRGKIQDEITELQNQLLNVSQSATFNGQNWLDVGDSTARRLQRHPQHRGLVHPRQHRRRLDQDGRRRRQQHQAL